MNKLERYLTFARSHTSLFKNPAQGGNKILLNEDEVRIAETDTMNRMKNLGLPMQWAQVGIAYEDQYLLLLHDAICLPNGTVDVVSRLVGRGEGKPGVVILPFYKDHILLIRHFRHNTRAWHLELPQGFLKPGKTSQQSALEELDEEITATVSSLVSLGQMHPDAEVSSDCLDLFYAQIESYGETEKGEAISATLMVTVAEFEHMIRQAEITDANAIVAYTRAKLRGLLRTGEINEVPLA